MQIEHEITPDGESTEKWAIRKNGFMGSVKQIICCARCGEYFKGGIHTSRHYRDVFKPTFHAICDDCHNALPDRQ